MSISKSVDQSRKASFSTFAKVFILVVTLSFACFMVACGGPSASSGTTLASTGSSSSSQGQEQAQSQQPQKSADATASSTSTSGTASTANQSGAASTASGSAAAGAAQTGAASSGSTAGAPASGSAASGDASDAGSVSLPFTGGYAEQQAMEAAAENADESEGTHPFAAAN